MIIKLAATLIGISTFVACNDNAQASQVEYDFQYRSVTSSASSPDFFGSITVDDDEIVLLEGYGSEFGSITKLLDPGTFPYWAANDNRFNETGPYVDFFGVSFETQNGGTVNLYSSGDSYYFASEDGEVEGTLEVTPTASSVPEPYSITLLGIGFAGLARLRHGMRRKIAIRR